ncbi:MAG: FtsX-like permease family protein [Pseudomonadota bacterium]
MSRQQSLLPLSREPSTRLLPWIIGVMVYLAVLIFAGALLLADTAATWNRDLGSGLTVQIPPDEGDEAEALDRRVDEVRKILEELEEVQQVAVIPADVTALALEPWLGSAVDMKDLPIPRVIEVRLAENAEIDTARLFETLEAVAPGVVIDNHDFWRGQILTLVRGFEMLATVAIGLIGFTAMAAVVFTTRSSVTIQRDVIEVLHLIGATDDYVAQEFQRQTFRISLLGGVLGTVFALATLLLLGRMAANLDTALMPDLSLAVWQSVLLWIVPLLACLIATVTARRTVLKALRRMP